MLAVADRHAVRLLEFSNRRALPSELKRLQRNLGQIEFDSSKVLEELSEQLSSYFQGDSMTFTVRTKQCGTPFEETVWTALRSIPLGQTRSYAQVAQSIGRPMAVRAVARTNGANQVSIVVPCHRVIGSDGSLVGYGGGISRKKWLLDHERRSAQKFGT